MNNINNIAHGTILDLTLEDIYRKGTVLYDYYNHRLNGLPYVIKFDLWKSIEFRNAKLSFFGIEIYSTTGKLILETSVHIDKLKIKLPLCYADE